jgi:hypothetical protein
VRFVNEFSDAFSAAFDVDVVEPPVGPPVGPPLTPSHPIVLPASGPPLVAATDLCPPETDWSCAFTDEEIAELDTAVKERSERLAWSTLVALTGYQVAPCPIEVRPCAERCAQGSYIEAPVVAGGYQGGGQFTPVLSGGYWLNSCGCGSGVHCSCSGFSEIYLPAPVGPIVEVVIDGQLINPSNYRVDNNLQLVGQNDLVWPLCQDMGAPAGAVGTFVITYYRGFPPDSNLIYAAGVLATEFYKACTGAKGCRLPAGVTTVTRQGITMEIQTGLFVGGFTGLPEVDAVIAIYNPYGLKSQPTITSPETVGARRTTWRW